MDSYFAVLLFLFFTQGLFGGNRPLARAIAILLVGALAAALLYTLQ